MLHTLGSSSREMPGWARGSLCLDLACICSRGLGAVLCRASPHDRRLVAWIDDGRRFSPNGPRRPRTGLALWPSSPLETAASALALLFRVISLCIHGKAEVIDHAGTADTCVGRVPSVLNRQVG